MTATYENIATTTVGTATGTVTFSSISASFTDLIVVVNGAVTAGTVNLFFRFNNDTATNYSYTYLDGSGSVASSGRSSNNDKLIGNNFGYFTTSFNANYIIQIQNYSNTTTNKTCLTRSNAADNGVSAVVGLWRNTAAINRIDLFTSSSTFVSGSTFTLYGIKAE
jgi:hypothetical protein